jgi:lipoprotein-anchoring transpeptidase ErfK/SrfK
MRWHFGPECKLLGGGKRLDDGEYAVHHVLDRRTGKQWSGTAIINGKYLHPAWTPPAKVKHDKPNLPDVIPGGGGRNPMGQPRSR